MAAARMFHLLSSAIDRVAKSLVAVAAMAGRSGQQNALVLRL
jgi:hypothetical protein